MALPDSAFMMCSFGLGLVVSIVSVWTNIWAECLEIREQEGKEEAWESLLTWHLPISYNPCNLYILLLALCGT